MREASTRSVVVPAAVAAPVETTTVPRAVDGFSCDGYKVQHNPKKRKTKKREIERETRFETGRGCKGCLIRGKERGGERGMAGCNVGRCFLLHTEFTGAE